MHRKDDLEHRLETLYTQVPPPPKGLASGRDRMLAQAAQLRTRTRVTQQATIPSGRHGMKLALVYRLIAAVAAIIVGMAATGGGIALAAADTVPGNIDGPPAGV